MKFDKPKCPECGKLADGTIDTIPGVAHMTFSKRGTAKYTGETTVWWDDQYTERDPDGRVSLYCENGHRWESGMKE